jgi:hypothetical protein
VLNALLQTGTGWLNVTHKVAGLIMNGRARF